MTILELLAGRRLANREREQRRIGAFDAIPAMGLDALSSSAYGPEAALAMLAPLGAASLAYIGWIMAPIVALAAILLASYWQTIKAYPNNGGAYVVTRENLGTNASLFAGAALMIDYVLNVAVGISAGVAALASAVPALHEFTLPLCLGVLALITLANLRGTLDAGRLMALPTYLFVASFALILGVGIFRAASAGGHPQPVVSPPGLGDAAQGADLWLLVRAFAAGCTAMTGIEAVSNGMSAFREPRIVHAHRTLALIVLILSLLLAGIAFLTTAYGIGAMDQTQEGYRSVLSQLAAAVLGRGAPFFIAMASLLCVLALSANTSFVDFPRLCRMVAQDGFLPRSFAIAGRRLVFSVGIAYLAGAAGLLLLAFGGITDRLIPLFAIGAFLTFTLSQVGMVVHWRRAMRGSRDRREARSFRAHLLINGVGAAVTAVALGVIIAAKFAEGAWITVLAVPCVILLLKSIRAYYDRLAVRLGDPGTLEPWRAQPPIILVVMDDWNRPARKAIELALSLSPDVIAVHMTQLSGPEEEQRSRSLRSRFSAEVEEPARAAGFPPPRLVLLEAQYRSMHEPVLKLARDLEAKFGERRIAVLVPEVAKQRWYQELLHVHRARHLRRQLLLHGGPRLTIISMPWYLEEESQRRGPAAEPGSESAERALGARVP